MSNLFSSVSVDLVIVTCWCGIPHAVPNELRNKQLRDHRDGREQTSIYCPLGHSYIIAGEGEAAKLKRELKERDVKLQRERARRDQIQAELRTTEHRLNATKGVVTKLKKRCAAGVCPCCQRNFKQLASHMQNKHPEFVKEHGVPEITLIIPKLTSGETSLAD